MAITYHQITVSLPLYIMSDNASKPAADNAAGAGSAKSNPDVASTGAAQAAKDAAKQGARSEGNPALRMMFFGKA